MGLQGGTVSYNTLLEIFAFLMAVITQKYTLYGIRYKLYDLLSATDEIT